MKMERLHRLERWYAVLQGALITSGAAIAAFFDSTSGYLLALAVAFIFNIFAGFRADEVKVKIQRLIPPILLTNFNGNKFKDSLIELFLIFAITYVLKALIDLMHYNDQSSYVVQVLVWIAIYYYVRNGLRNLAIVYPKVKWIRMLYSLIAFKMKEIFGNDIGSIIEQEEIEKKKYVKKMAKINTVAQEHVDARIDEEEKAIYKETKTDIDGEIKKEVKRQVRKAVHKATKKQDKK